MGKINYYHKGLKEKWGSFSLCFQMTNIGSEVSRALKWKDKNKITSENALARALELLDFSIEDAVKNHKGSGRMEELVIARYALCDYFYGGNEFKQTPESIMKYYDEFAYLASEGK